MDATNLKLAVLADDADERARLAQILDFIGIAATTDLATASAIVLSGSAVAEVPPGIPVIYVGAQPPPLANVVVQVESLRYHELNCALHELCTILAEELTTQEDARLAAIVGNSSDVRSLRALVQRVAPRSVPVLLSGESGTGKAAIAKLIHQLSPNAEGPFVPVNCEVIPEGLLESELFGHEKGAFVGAVANKVGRFELAHGGTLYLNSVDRLPQPLQLKLARALESGSFERIGSAEPRRSQVRLVTSCQTKLERFVESGEFREDLYYALAVSPIVLSPLRNRPEDIEHIVSSVSADIERKQKITLRLSVDVLEALRNYPWPGNERELVNLLQRLSIQQPNDVVTTRELPQKFKPGAAVPLSKESPLVSVVSENQTPEDVRLPVNGIDLKDYLARLERSLIEQALQDSNEVVARAADRLHVRRTTLVEKMRKYGIARAS